MSEHIKTSIAGVVDFLDQAPDAAVIAYPTARAVLDGDLRFHLEFAGETALTSDMKKSVGGNESGPNPGWILSAALASCLGTTIAMRAATQDVELTTLEVVVDTTADARGLLGSADVTAATRGYATTVTIGSPNADEATLNEIVAWADEHSVVAATLREPPSQELTIEVV